VPHGALGVWCPQGSPKRHGGDFTNPVINIPDYPDLDQRLGSIRTLPQAILDSGIWRNEPRASNMGIAGAATALPGEVETMEYLSDSSREGEKWCAEPGVSPGGRQQPSGGTIPGVLSGARGAGRQVLLEPEGYALLDAAGIRTPRHLFVRTSAEAAHVDTSVFSGSRIVVKVVSPEILHKSDVGGIAIVPNRPDEVRSAIRTMEKRLGENALRPCWRVRATDSGLGASSGGVAVDRGFERSDDRAGGSTEFLAGNFGGRDIAIVSPVLPPPRLEDALPPPWWTSRRATFAPAAAAASAATRGCVILRDRPVRAEQSPSARTCSSPAGPRADSRPLIAGAPNPPGRSGRQRCSSRTRSSACRTAQSGVSSSTAAWGLRSDRIYVVKPGRTLEGCRCVLDVACQRRSVHAAVSAAQVRIITDVVATGRRTDRGPWQAEEGDASAIVDEMRAALLRSRTTAWEGPLINSSNCLGIQSKPGRYDTMFIPEYKLPAAPGRVSPVAVISQSGAFAVARASKLRGIHPS
jgi:hypothetical protein